eukprot:Seg2574.2 transcript_id=Seg2574.2/GoldUCD/mRNA.D3Y31 product="Mitogen-activated protein kinase kinase kinase 2" protein_id=Seg2574.2/GoldUCD/D3Y31
MASVQECFGQSLIEAVKENDASLVKVLIAQGAPLDAVDECGYTALHWTALYDKPECAHALLTHGSQRCEIDVTDKDGYTALQLGIRHGHKDITQLLVTYGADINGNAKNLPSPVELAEKKGFNEILSVLHSAQEKQESMSARVPKVWKLGKLLGCGGFGKVYIGYDIENNREIAIKKVTTTGRKSAIMAGVNALDSEIKILKNLAHKSIVQYYGMEVLKLKMYIFMEYLPGGSMRDYVAKHGGLKEDKLRTYCHQVLEGVAYLHANMIIHRDIKGANILLTCDYTNAKLADFGLSKRLQRCSTTSGLNTTLGSPYWMAPEVVKASPMKGEGYGRKADIWSVGCTVIEMLTCKPPWNDMEPMTAVYNIGTGRKPPELPSDLSGSLRDFTLQTFKRDPKSRPYAKDLLNHPFITNESQSITKQANYRIRRSIETINKRLSQTIEKANEVRSEFHTIWTFILSLLIFAIAVIMAIFLKQN